MPKLTARLLLAMFYLGVLFFGAGFIMQRVQSFEGVLIVEKGRTERWATCPAGEGRSFSTAHRNMPAEVIGFDNPRAAVRILGARDQFDAAPLPYRLKLADVVVLERPPDEATLEIIKPGETISVPAQPGKAVSLPEGTLVIVGMEPWRGLIRDGRGEPMAAFSLKRDKEPWSPVVFVDAKHAVRPRPNLAVLLRWCNDETQAHALTDKEAPPVLQTRWGVRDVGRIHWFDSLLPGTGVVTADGAEYTLLEIVENEGGEIPLPVSAIIVERKQEGAARRIRVEANAADGNGEIFLESFQDDAVIWLRAWRDGAALATVHNKGESVKPTLLNEGDTLCFDAADEKMQLRLDQIMSRALPVLDGAVQALVLDTPGGERRIREGQSIQLDESRLRFRRIPQPPVTRYAFEVIATDKELRAFTLSPGESRRIGQWRFTHDMPNTEAETVATVRAERIPGTPAQYVGLLLFGVGALGLVIIRFADWRSVGREDAATIMEEDKWTVVPPDGDPPNYQPDDKC